MTDLWQPSIDPGRAPDGLVVRVATESGHLLVEEAIEDLPSVVSGRPGDEHAALALDWLRDHPGDEVRAHVYDGDTGRCITTIVMEGRDHRRD